MIAVIAFIACFAFAVFLPLMDAERHYKKIVKNESNDTLKERYHLLHFADRFVILPSTAVLANTYIDVPIWSKILLIAAFLLFFGVWFGIAFNTRLSLLRGLNPWYVSHDPRAAKTDQLLIKYAAEFSMRPEYFHKWMYRIALVITAIIFVLAYVLILFV